MIQNKSHFYFFLFYFWDQKELFLNYFWIPVEEYTSKRNQEVLKRIREELPSQILKCIQNSKLFYNWHQNEEISGKEQVQNRSKYINI